MFSVDHKSTGQVEPLLVAVKALARMLSTSVRSAWRMKAGGKLPCSVRIGHSVRWNVETIREWIDLGCPDRAAFEAGLGAKKRGEVKRG